MPSQKRRWFRAALQLKGSVIPSVLPRILLCGGFGIVVSLLYFWKVPIIQPITGGFIPTIVLGLLLVFRTNTAYERFWEGRKAWGTLNNNIRNLSRQIWVSVSEQDTQDRQDKVAALRLLIAFAVAVKLRLRHETVNDELQALMSPSHFQSLQDIKSPSLKIAFWIGDYLQQQHCRGRLSAYQLSDLQTLLNSMVDVLGICERILNTPMPMAYAIHLRQLLLVYCLFIPFEMVENLVLWTGPVTALVSFTLFGIEAIGEEIENPFGLDANDLPLDTLCETMLRNIEDLIAFSPSQAALMNPAGEEALFAH